MTERLLLVHPTFCGRSTTAEWLTMSITPFIHEMLSILQYQQSATARTQYRLSSPFARTSPPSRALAHVPAQQVSVCAVCLRRIVTVL